MPVLWDVWIPLFSCILFYCDLSGEWESTSVLLVLCFWVSIVFSLASVFYCGIDTWKCKTAESLASGCLDVDWLWENLSSVLELCVRSLILSLGLQYSEWKGPVVSVWTFYLAGNFSDSPKPIKLLQLSSSFFSHSLILMYQYLLTVTASHHQGDTKSIRFTRRHY